MESNPSLERDSLERPSPRQVILGLFVIGQLTFLVLSNAISHFQDVQGRIGNRDVNTAIDRVAPGYSSQSGHAWKIADEVSTALRRWAQVTNQPQAWGLFAPRVWQVTGFPAVVLIFTDEPAAGPEFLKLLIRLNQGEGDVPGQLEMLRSENEPLDRYHFLRVGNFRLRRYESNIILYLGRQKDEADASARERWQGSIRDHLRDRGEMIEAYMKWRLSLYQELHPDRPKPQQVVLVERVYAMLPPEDESGACWTGPTILPLARWQPNAERASDNRAIERFNPVTEQFEIIPK
jgi:hypothetical protein